LRNEDTMRLSRSFIYGSTMLALMLAGCPGDDGTADTGPGTTMEPGSTTMEPGTTTMEPGSTTMEPGSTTMEPGSTTMEPDTTTNVDTGSTTMEPGGVNFEMTLMGYPHDGMDVELAVVEAGTTNVVLTLGGTIAGMELVLSDMSGALTDGASYDIFWYVDVNESGGCDAPPDDHSWEMLAQAAGGTGLTTSHTHDGNWVDVCANF
jgi:hypothetical protein